MSLDKQIEAVSKKLVSHTAHATAGAPSRG